MAVSCVLLGSSQSSSKKSSGGTNGPYHRVRMRNCRNPGSSGQSLRRGPTGANHRPRDTRRPHRRRPLPVGGGARPGRLRSRLHRPRQRLGRGGRGQGVQPGRGAGFPRRPRGPHRPEARPSQHPRGRRGGARRGSRLSDLPARRRRAVRQERPDRRPGGARDRRRLRRPGARPRARRRASRRQARQHPGVDRRHRAPDRLRHRPGRGRPRADRRRAPAGDAVLHGARTGVRPARHRRHGRVVGRPHAVRDPVRPKPVPRPQPVRAAREPRPSRAAARPRAPRAAPRPLPRARARHASRPGPPPHGRRAA